MTTKLASTNLINRRQFLQITAVAGSLLAGGYGLGRLPRQSDATWRETRLLMGTLINLVIVAESQGRGRAAAGAAFAEMERLIRMFDHRRADGPLGILNRAGSLSEAPPELVEVVIHAIRYGDLTGGAFDISVKPLLDRARSAENGIAPNRPPVDYRQIVVNGRSLSFAQPHMALTLDGIAKGRVVDGAVAQLNRAGFSDVLVEAGGDLVGSGHRTDGTPWQVAIAHPRKPQTAVSRLAITTQAVATSGDYRHTFSSDFRHHHIIDPHSGSSPPQLASVTVVAPSAMDADALSTALMVLGITQGLALIERLPHVEALLVTKQMESHQSSSFGRFKG